MSVNIVSFRDILDLLNIISVKYYCYLETDLDNEFKGEIDIVSEYEDLIYPIIKSLWIYFPNEYYEHLIDKKDLNINESAITNLIEIDHLSDDFVLIYPEIDDSLEFGSFKNQYSIIVKKIDKQLFETKKYKFEIMFELIEKFSKDVTLILENSISKIVEEYDFFNDPNIYWYTILVYIMSDDLIIEDRISEEVYLDKLKLLKAYAVMNNFDEIVKFITNVFDIDDLLASILQDIEYEEDTLDKGYIKNHPDKVISQFIIIICGIENAVHVSLHSAIATENEEEFNPQVISLFEILWYDLNKVAEIPSDHWPAKVQKYSDKKMDAFTNNITNVIEKYIDEMIDELHIQSPIFLTPRKILVNFDKHGVNDHSGISKTWRKKFGKLVIKKMKKIIKIKFKSDLFRIPITEVDYLEINEHEALEERFL